MGTAKLKNLVAYGLSAERTSAIFMDGHAEADDEPWWSHIVGYEVAETVEQNLKRFQVAAIPTACSAVLWPRRPKVSPNVFPAKQESLSVQPYAVNVAAWPTHPCPHTPPRFLQSFSRTPASAAVSALIRDGYNFGATWKVQVPGGGSFFVTGHKKHKGP